MPDAPSRDTAPASSGQASSGQASSGQASSGQVTLGQVTPGQVTAGQVTSAQATSTAASLATESEGGGRPLRADARRNRDRLLEVAVLAFSQNGPDVTLDAIAKEAGVGIGTLYRHFPTREALIEAAYRNELARLCDSVPELLEAMPPDQAARTWMDRYIDYMATKRGMADALRVVIASGGTPYAQSRDRLLTAIATLLKAGNEAGTLRADVPPGDALTSLSGVALAAGAPDQRDQAGRLLDLLMDALRYRP